MWYHAYHQHSRNVSIIHGGKEVTVPAAAVYREVCLILSLIYDLLYRTLCLCRVTFVFCNLSHII